MTDTTIDPRIDIVAAALEDQRDSWVVHVGDDVWIDGTNAAIIALQESDRYIATVNPDYCRLMCHADEEAMIVERVNMHARFSNMLVNELTGVIRAIEVDDPPLGTPELTEP